MSNLNVERIINGTLYKRLSNKYNEMKESGLTEESAAEYKSIYENEPLSSILHESELIFKEPIHGLPFFESLFKNESIPPYQYKIQRSKLNNFILECGDMMPETQKLCYNKALDCIDTAIDNKKNLIAVSNHALTDDCERKMDDIYDKIYTKTYDNEDNLITDIQSLKDDQYMTPLQEAVMFDLCPIYAPKAFAYSLNKSVTCFESVKVNPVLYSESVSKFVTWKYLMEDATTMSKIRKITNPTVKLILEEVRNQDYRRAIDGIFTQEEPDFDPAFVSTENAILRMFDEDIIYESTDEVSLQARVVNAHDALAIVEAVSAIVYSEYETEDPSSNTRCSSVLEMAGVDSMTIADAIDYLVEKSTDLNAVIETALEYGDPESFFEYTRRGEATPVIRKTAGNIREEIYAHDSSKKKTKGSSSVRDRDIDFDEDDEDYDEPTKIRKKDASSNFDREREAKSKPTREKDTVTRTIQNKAMDLDVKMQKRAGKMKEGMTNLKNAAKAVTRIPANIVKSLKTGIEEFNNMDENRRKEKILQPGYRSQIFKYMKTAIVYGAIWEYKRYMVIVAWLVKHTIAHPFFKVNKNRNLRLRNELTHELDTEIAVTEEKINDANASGDQQEKYELMRIKKKLEAEKIRVQTNSKFI